jgi:glycosyltransferase involved in cell wall biosynthesis
MEVLRKSKVIVVGNLRKVWNKASGKCSSNTFSGVPIIEANKRYKIASLTTVASTTKFFFKGQFPALCRAGVYPTIICADDPDLQSVLPEGSNVIPIELTRVLSPLKDFKALCRLYKIFRKEKYDLVQYASPKAALLGSVAAFFARIPIRLYLVWGLYYEGQAGIKRNIHKFFEWVICLFSTHVLPNSHEMADTIVRQKIVPRKKCQVLLNGSACGIDFNEFDIEKWRPQRKTVREALGIPAGSVIVGIFGRLTGDKGVNEGVEAFLHIADRNPHVYLLVIGNQEEKDKLLPETIEQIKNHPRILNLPHQESLLPYYSALDIICLPTYREGFPQTPLEAQAMEVPVVSTDISGVREAVVKNKTGFLVEPKNSKALVEPLMKLIRDKSLRKEMGCEGRKRTYRLFNQEKIIQAVVQHRLSLLKKSNNSS